MVQNGIDGLVNINGHHNVVVHIGGKATGLIQTTGPNAIDVAAEVDLHATVGSLPGFSQHTLRIPRC